MVIPVQVIMEAPEAMEQQARHWAALPNIMAEEAADGAIQSPFPAAEKEAVGMEALTVQLRLRTARQIRGAEAVELGINLMDTLVQPAVPEL